MNLDELLALVSVVALTAYLTFALLRPELFG